MNLRDRYIEPTVENIVKEHEISISGILYVTDFNISTYSSGYDSYNDFNHSLIPSDYYGGIIDTTQR